MTQILEAVQCERPATETHGLLCGLLCTLSVEKAKLKWFKEVLSAMQTQPQLVAQRADEIKELDAFFGETVSRLNDSQFEFHLLLEEESASIENRINSLANWCSGFNLGIGLGELGSSANKLPADTAELLEDFQHIARSETPSHEDFQAGSSAEDEIDYEQTEQDFVELEEYVRVGVMIINEELQPVTKTAVSSATGNTLH